METSLLIIELLSVVLLLIYGKHMDIYICAGPKFVPCAFGARFDSTVDDDKFVTRTSLT